MQINIKRIRGNDISIESSPMEPLLIAYGEVGPNYGMVLLKHSKSTFENVGNMCLTNQIVSRVVFSPTGREIVAAAMSAGHIFILKVTYILNY